MPTVINGTSGVSQVQDGTVTLSKLASNSVDSSKIVDASIATGDIASNAVTQSQLATAMLPLGVGQTWQNVTGSRTYSTDYTNSTGRPILVVMQIGFASNTNIWFQVDGVNVLQVFGGPSANTQATILVPAGSVYRLNGTITIQNWSELR